MSCVKRSTKISIFDPKSKHLRGFQSQNTVISWSFCILWTRCENGNRSQIGPANPQGLFRPWAPCTNGHASLIRTAAAQCDLVVVSILVNPTQFNESSDFESYPRTLESDAQKAQAAGADAVFAPSAEDLYGGTPQAPSVDWGALTSAYEGAHRPGHFDGVVAVVDLLFDAVQPKVAVFGEKDLQQVAVVKRLAKERHPEVHVVVGSLIRDAHGLALSSRNSRLSPEGLRTALSLSRCLRAVDEAVGSGDSVELALGSLGLNWTPWPAWSWSTWMWWTPKRSSPPTALRTLTVTWWWPRTWKASVSSTTCR